MQGGATAPLTLQPKISQAEEPVIPANWRRYEGRIPAYCSGNTTIYVDCPDPLQRQRERRHPACWIMHERRCPEK